METGKKTDLETLLEGKASWGIIFFLLLSFLPYSLWVFPGRLGPELLPGSVLLTCISVFSHLP